MKNKTDENMYRRRMNCILVKDFLIMLYPDEDIEIYKTALFDYCTINKIKRHFNKNYAERFLAKDFNKNTPSKNKFIEMNPINCNSAYIERYGMLLMRFLNADFSNYKQAYNTFFFAYGFEYLKSNYAYDFALENNWCFETEEIFVKFIKQWYKYNKATFLAYQESFRECVNYVYNLNGDNRDSDMSIISKFKAFVLHNMNMADLERGYIIEQNQSVNNDDVNNYNVPLSELVKMIDKKKIVIDNTISYKAKNGIWGICYKLLEDIVYKNRMPIKVCENDSKYFIPHYRIDEIYCDYEKLDGTKCKEIGAKKKYAKKAQNDPIIAAYNKVYQAKIMRTRRNPENKIYKEQFENFKVRGTILKKAYLLGKIDEDKYNELLKIISNDEINTEIEELIIMLQ